jgi:hypothetical protein
VQIDGEVNILRGERDQAKDIIDDLSKKLTVVNAVIDEFQSERQVCVCVTCVQLATPCLRSIETCVADPKICLAPRQPG